MTTGFRCFTFNQSIEQTHILCDCFCTHAMCKIFQATFSNLFELTCCLIPDNVCVLAVSVAITVFTYRFAYIIPFRNFHTNACDNISFFGMVNFCYELPIIDDSSSFCFNQYKPGIVCFSIFIF